MFRPERLWEWAPAVERSHPSRRAADHVAYLDSDRPPRRRRSALLGGGVLIASSPVAVGAGLFVPGFAALGLGALLLLLPPRERHQGTHRAPLGVVRRQAAAGGRAAIAFARGTAHVGARMVWAVEHFASGSGREGVARIGRATLDGALAVGRASAVAGSRGWSAMQSGAPRAWRGLVAAVHSLARETRSASVRILVRARPILRRAWAASLVGSRRTAQELTSLAHSAFQRLSALIDSRHGPR